MHYPALLDIKPSRRLRAALVIVHLLAFAALAAALPGFWRLLPLPPLALSLVRAWRSQCEQCIRLERDGRVTWRPGRNDEGVCDVLADSSCFSWLVVIRARAVEEGARAEGVRVATVLADSLPAADFRRLQIWMRWVLPFRRAEGGG